MSPTLREYLLSFMTCPMTGLGNTLFIVLVVYNWKTCFSSTTLSQLLA